MTAGLDPRRIEAEIARMRERESAAFGGGAKANLFNLVVASLSGGLPEEPLRALLGRRPCRIIRLEPKPPDRSGAVVTGTCSPGTQDRGVCFEEISLDAGGDPLGDGAAAWTPLLVRDLPTFLWLCGPWSAGSLPGREAAPGHPCPRRLPSLPGREAVAHVDKLIVDSSASDEPAAALPALHRLREAARGRLAIADLAWSRILALRVLAARAFDPAPAREALADLAAVTLRGATRAEALLFFLWLAARLGWRASLAGGAASFTDAAGRGVAAVHEAPAPLAHGAALSFVSRGGSRVEAACTANEQPLPQPPRRAIPAIPGYRCAAVGDDRGPWRIAPDGELLLAEVDGLKQDAQLDEVLRLSASAARQTASAGGPLGERRE